MEKLSPKQQLRPGRWLLASSCLASLRPWVPFSNTGNDTGPTMVSGMCVTHSVHLHPGVQTCGPRRRSHSTHHSGGLRKSQWSIWPPLGHRRETGNHAVQVRQKDAVCSPTVRAGNTTSPGSALDWVIKLCPVGFLPHLSRGLNQGALQTPPQLPNKNGRSQQAHVQCLWHSLATRSPSPESTAWAGQEEGHLHHAERLSGKASPPCLPRGPSASPSVFAALCWLPWGAS